MKNTKLFLSAVATMVGTIIGAGVLGIPYAIAHAGFWTGIVDIVLLGIVVMLIYLYLGEVVLRTKGFHQLTGYAEKYLGRPGKKWMAFAMIFGIYGALVAYILGEGQAFAAIFGVGEPAGYSIAFFILAATIVYLGLEFVAESDFIGMAIALGIIIIVAVIAAPSINLENYTSFSATQILAPYGVILFAFLGASAVPQVGMELVKNKNLIRRAIILGLLFPMLAYLIFSFAVVGVTGLGTTEVATIGLGAVLGEKMVILGNIFAIFAMATSFITLGLALKQMYEYDYKWNSNLAWALTVLPPLAIALGGFTSFVRVISLAGIVSGGVEGIIIVLMFKKAKKKGDRNPEFKIGANGVISWLLIGLFIIGVAHYLWQALQGL